VIKSSTVYPYGTTEKFPAMQDSAANQLSQTAHYYMECSNKGICDRKTGECECFDGYEGTACQRASCPNDCSGHGTCHSIQYLANNEYSNVYELWDAKQTMGCKCDPPFTGADCSSRDCKYGTDPLYDDNSVEVRVNKVNLDITSSAASALTGTYAIKFYDVFGEDYVTEPIAAQQSDAAASCTSITSALKSLPNKVISDVSCTAAAHSTNKGVKHVITFNKNPGPLKQIELDTKLDGKTTDSLTVSSGTVSSNIYQSGISGEFTDYFATKCSVQVTGNVYTHADTAMHNKVGAEKVGFLATSSAADTKTLKKCLGDADGLSSNNVDVEDWDYGYYNTTYTTFAGQYVHAVKLQATASPFNANYALIWSDGNTFQTVASVETDGATYDVYATSGVAQRVHTDKQYYNEKGEHILAYFTQYDNVVYTNYDASCENSASTVDPCLEKGDHVFLVDGNYQDLHSAAQMSLATGTTGLYTITKIWSQPHDATSSQNSYETRFRFTVDRNINWDGSYRNTTGDGSYRVEPKTISNLQNHTQGGRVAVWKFTPSSTGAEAYTHTSQCSNRGTCDSEEGVCKCFKGYTNDNCDTQSALAV